jgi:NADH-quinone oxidoreductase subunit H
MFYIIIYFIKFILFFIPLLVAIAFLTLLERKIIASMQQRRGPNVVGFLGLLQPLADGFKLVLKETLLPSFASTLLFLIAPIITFACALLLWFVIPYNNP